MARAERFELPTFWLPRQTVPVKFPLNKSFRFEPGGLELPTFWFVAIRVKIEGYQRKRDDLTNDRNLCVFRSDGVFGNHSWINRLSGLQVRESNRSTGHEYRFHFSLHSYFTHAIPSAPGPVCNLLLTVSVFRSIATTAPSCARATNAREPSGVIWIPSG